ncbi:MAG: UDP-N-acetylglucosamine--LPS N-acetylglucosamine transferase [Pseudomonadota bacterium]
MDQISKDPQKTVLAIASQGGHWVQLRRMRAAWAGCRVIYVTTQPGYLDEVRASEPDAEFLTVPDANLWQKFRLIRQAVSVAWILLRHRPDAVITTGAAPGYFAVRIGSMLGAKTVWVDSIANGETLSLSGARAGPHASLWLTQWPHLATPEGAEARTAEPSGPRYRGASI